MQSGRGSNSRSFLSALVGVRRVRQKLASGWSVTRRGCRWVGSLRFGMRRLAVGLMACIGALAATISLTLVGASAASPCAGSEAKPNALTTTSADGTVVHGSACADLIVISSPAVRQVKGGAGSDTIYVNPRIPLVEGGEGDDVIYGDLPAELDGAPEGPVPPPQAPAYPPAQEPRKGDASASIAEKNCEANVSCYGGIGSQKLIGSSGNDKIFGQRGNDEIFGNAGDDQLFGGIGDEALIQGSLGSDLLSGGLGADHLNGGEGSDLVRGDGTVDTIEDTGSSGTDTLSFATAVTPGFSGSVSPAGFPGEGGSEERGVYVRLDSLPACESEGSAYAACDNNARFGGGNDTIAAWAFENVIGSPFADVIYGSFSTNRIDGGGGTDAIYGLGGSDAIYGGADGDYIDGGEGGDTLYGQGGANHCPADASDSQHECSGTSESVTQRDTSKISVGFIATSLPETLAYDELYLTGSKGADRVTASFGFEGSKGYVSFATEGESAIFDTSSTVASEGCAYTATLVKCTLPKPLDSIVMAGMAGNDRLALSISEKFWETTVPVLLGGEGSDEVLGSAFTEDLLVDGNGFGNDIEKAYNYDDALLNNEGADALEGGNGNDLLLSSGTCEGDTLQGAEAGAADGTAQNSASWAKVPSGQPGVVADLQSEAEYKGTAGNSYSSGPACASGSLDKLRNVDDIEGTNGNDLIYGDKFANNLLGRSGEDGIWAREGDDNVEAKDEGDYDHGGGATGTDTCTLDAIDSFTSCNP
jgi:Ca2+-binding RTX toxin-like protein